MIRGAAEYCRREWAGAGGSLPAGREHEAALAQAEQLCATWREVPVWIAGLVVPPAGPPAGDPRIEREDHLMSLAFAMENLFVAARALGLGTVPVQFHLFVEPEVRGLLGVPAHADVPVVTPLGHPAAFPVSLPGPLARRARPWRSLVHEERFGRPRAT